MPIETLMTAAEIAVGIAGFTAVVAALGRLDPESEVGQLRLFSLLSVPFASVLFALLPVVLLYLQLGDHTSIRVSSGAMAAFTISWYVFVLPQARRHESLDVLDRFFLVVLAIAGLNTIVQLANLVLIEDRWVFGVYFAGLVWLQTASVLGLFRAIRRRPDA